MILFVTDQIAGAEYLAPLLRKWKSEGRFDWKVLSSAQSSICLTRSGISHVVLQSCDEATAGEWIEKLMPDSALLSTSVDSFLEGMFVRELQRRQIPCAQLIDNWLNYSRRFQAIETDGTQTLNLPDWILTLDAIAKQRMVTEGLPEEKIKIIGQPHWEESLREFRDRHPKSDSGLALMVTQPISHFYGKGLGYDELDFVQCSLESWDSLGFDVSRLHFLVHPAESIHVYTERLKENGRKITLIQNPEVELAEYSLIVGMFSSILTQSLIVGVPTVSLQPGAVGEDRCFLSERGLIQRFCSSPQFVNFLREEWLFRGEISNQRDKIKEIVAGSLDRLEDFLMNLMETGRKCVN